MINPRDLQKAMQRMGMNLQEIEAKEVIILKKDNTQIKIKNPSVSKISISGQTIFQIAGVEEFINFTEEDIKLVMEQTNCSEEDAIDALKQANGDLAKAILSIKKS
ncbi:MAG: nascent polypeptide-associated complex protein [Candidatus Woesearchaeota archaeon]